MLRRRIGEIFRVFALLNPRHRHGDHRRRSTCPLNANLSVWKHVCDVRAERIHVLEMELYDGATARIAPGRGENTVPWGAVTYACARGPLFHVRICAHRLDERSDLLRGDIALS